MNKLIFALGLLLITSQTTQAEEPPGKNSAKLNTQIYEKESEEKSLTATVEIFREIQGSWEVRFSQDKVFYTIPEGSAAQPILAEAHRKKKKVTVKLDTAGQRVLSATRAESE